MQDYSAPQVSEAPELDPHYPGVKIVQRIPQRARHLAATKLAEVLDRCTEENTKELWSELLNFAGVKLRQPQVGDKDDPSNPSLTTKLKSQLNSNSPSDPRALNAKKKKRQKKNFQ